MKDDLIAAAAILGGTYAAVGLFCFLFWNLLQLLKGV